MSGKSPITSRLENSETSSIHVENACNLKSEKDASPLPKHQFPKPTNEKSIHRSHQYLSSWRLAVVILSLCLGTFLIALDINIIGVAAPKITTTFGSLNDVAWYGSAYLLTVTAFQPVMGFVYKYFNVRYAYLVCIFIFEVGSIICAAAASSREFIVGRAIAGLGAAGILQGALCIIGYVTELEKRPMCMGIVISVFGISVCVGPVLGGVFTDGIGWRWCFWINGPIGIVVIITLYLFLKLENHTLNSDRGLPFKEKLKHLDIAGAALFIGAICCLILALQWGGQTMPWKTSTVIGLFVGFGLLAFAFSYVQWKRGDDALIPLRVLRQRSFLLGTCFLFFFGMLNYVYSFYLPFYFQGVQGTTATASGVRIIAMVLPQIVTVIVVGGLVTKWGYYVPFMMIGQLMTVVGSGLITRYDLQTSTVAWAGFLVITGIGMGMGGQLPYTIVQAVLSESDAPIGNAISVFANQLGGVVAIPIGQALFLNSLRTEVPRVTSGISPESVMQAGASSLDLLTSGNSSVLAALREAYALSLRQTYILALAAGCAALLFTFGLEWKNLKTIDREKRENLSD